MATLRLPLVGLDCRGFVVDVTGMVDIAMRAGWSRSMHCMVVSAIAPGVAKSVCNSCFWRCSCVVGFVVLCLNSHLLAPLVWSETREDFPLRLHWLARVHSALSCLR